PVTIRINYGGLTNVTHSNRPTQALLACLATTTLLTACTKGSPEAGQPNTAPPSPTSSTTSSSASPTTGPSATPSSSAAPTTPPARPTAAKGLTLAAAEKFVRYYSDLLNYASTTGDTGPMLGVSEKGCENCKSYAAFVAKANGANGLLQGDYLEKITDVPELYRGKSGRIGGSAMVSIGAYISRESTSASPINLKAATYKREFSLSSQGGSWIMYEMKLDK
ncbi:DUF6318 family protein, partial [Kribbella sp.]|uniref:DUF6318 family protein n=1 Tax=Kribbella sp. TaxID=1871183 RepID=UPI002D67C7C4